jgi:hypothetical protein
MQMLSPAPRPPRKWWCCWPAPDRPCKPTGFKSKRKKKGKRKERKKRKRNLKKNKEKGLSVWHIITLFFPRRPLPSLPFFLLFNRSLIISPPLFFFPSSPRCFFGVGLVTGCGQ